MKYFYAVGWSLVNLLGFLFTLLIFWFLNDGYRLHVNYCSTSSGVNAYLYFPFLLLFFIIIEWMIINGYFSFKETYRRIINLVFIYALLLYLLILNLELLNHPIVWNKKWEWIGGYQGLGAIQSPLRYQVGYWCFVTLICLMLCKTARVVKWCYGIVLIISIAAVLNVLVQPVELVVCRG